MGSILLMTGLLGIILFLILLFVNAILGNSRIPSAVCLFLCFLLFARGAIATVDTKRQAVAQSATRPENTWVPSRDHHSTYKARCSSGRHGPFRE